MRRTEDWDLLIELESWDALRQLFQEYEQLGATQDVKKGRVVLGGLKFDLIPANLCDPQDGRLKWFDNPIDHLNMAGHEEAWATAGDFSLAGCTIKVASPEALVWLKLFAWNDRRDLKHLHILRHFDTTGGDALWDADPLPDLEAIRLEEAGAWLVGRQLSKTLKEHLLGLVRDIVGRLLQDEALRWELARFVGEPTTEREVEVVERL